jgi:hypothetical protein
MRSTVAQWALLLTCCGRTSEPGQSAVTGRGDGGGPGTDAGREIDAGAPPEASTPWEPPVGRPDAGAPACSAPPDGWIEQKITLETVNHGFAQTIAGNDEHFAVLGAAPSSANTYGGSAVFIYERSGSTWTGGAHVSGSSDPSEGFGAAIAIDGTTLAVGAPYADASEGAVYVFVRNGPAWLFAQRIAYPHSSTAPTAGFGRSIALRGDTLLVGAYGDSSVLPGSGRVYAYERAGTNWVPSSEIAGKDIAENDAFGAAVSFDGTRVAVLSQGVGSRGLAVTVFSKVTGGWVEESRFVPASQPSAPISNSVALDGDAILVSTNQGQVLAFRESAGAWAFDSELSPPYMGASAVALHGSVAAIGKREFVDLFERGASGWALRETLRAGDEPASRDYGSAVTLGSDSVAVLAPGDDDWGAGSGSVYAYVRAPGAQYDPICRTESTTTGSGTACTRSGMMDAICRNLGPGSGELHGSTPAGQLDLPYAWLDVTRGDMSLWTLVFGASKPRREDSVPELSIALNAAAVPLLQGTFTAEARLFLCDRQIPAPATVSITSANPSNAVDNTPLSGNVSIFAPGWSVQGTFSFEGSCRSFSSH